MSRPAIAGCGDRPENLLGTPPSGTVKKGAVGHRNHRNPVRLLTNPTKRINARQNASTPVLKMWAHLQRQGIEAARCTVEKIMRTNGWQGVMRARRPPRTTECDPAAARAPDLVKRQWKVKKPNLLEVADFTYVPMDIGGFAYTAFIIDAFAGLIAGWECSLP